MNLVRVKFLDSNVSEFSYRGVKYLKLSFDEICRICFNYRLLCLNDKRSYSFSFFAYAPKCIAVFSHCSFAKLSYCLDSSSDFFCSDSLCPFVAYDYFGDSRLFFSADSFDFFYIKKSLYNKLIELTKKRGGLKK